MNNLTQCNVIVNHKQKFLDPIFTNMNVESVTECMYHLVSKDPYHPALCMSLNLQQICDSETETVTKTYKYDYAKGDYFLLYNLLSNTDWSDIYNTNNVNESLDRFYNLIYHCINQAVPQKQGKLSNKGKFPNYFFLSKNIKI